MVKFRCLYGLGTFTLHFIAELLREKPYYVILCYIVGVLRSVLCTHHKSTGVETTRGYIYQHQGILPDRP